MPLRVIGNNNVAIVIRSLHRHGQNFGACVPETFSELISCARSQTRKPKELFANLIKLIS